jgi:hypothetical protein
MEIETLFHFIPSRSAVELKYSPTHLPVGIGTRNISALRLQNRRSNVQGTRVWKHLWPLTEPTILRFSLNPSLFQTAAPINAIASLALVRTPTLRVKTEGSAAFPFRGRRQRFPRPLYRFAK